MKKVNGMVVANANLVKDPVKKEIYEIANNLVVKNGGKVPPYDVIFSACKHIEADSSTIRIGIRTWCNAIIRGVDADTANRYGMGDK